MNLPGTGQNLLPLLKTLATSKDEQYSILKTMLIQSFNDYVSNHHVNFEISAQSCDLVGVSKDDVILDLTRHDKVTQLAEEFFEDTRFHSSFALQLACRYNWYNVALKLLQSDVSVEIKAGKHGDPPLIIAAYYNFTSIVKLLISNEADVSKEDLRGRSALHFAAQHGNDELCKLLLSQPFYTLGNVDKPDRAGKTPLHLAMSARKRDKVTSLLIAKGADIARKDTPGGRSALTMAASEGAADTLELLLDSVPEKMKPAYQQDIDDSLIIAVQVGSVKSITVLIEQGANVNMRLKAGKLTPLHVAAINGRVEVLKALLSHGADQDALDHRNWMPFHRACLNGHIDIVKMSEWEDKKYLEAPDNNGCLPIMLALLHGRTEVVKYLITMHQDFHVPFDQTDNEKMNIIHKAVESRKPEVLKLVLTIPGNDDVSTLVNQEDASNCTPLLHAGYIDNDKIVDLLLANGARIDAKDRRKQTVLHTASHLGYKNVVRSLVNAACKGDEWRKHLLSEDVDGNTPLHNAAEEGKKRVMEILLEKPLTMDMADDFINKMNEKYLTPLHLACRNGNSDAIKYLLANKANVCMKNSEGKTCLDEAAEAENYEVCKTLLQDKCIQETLWEGKDTICNAETFIREHPTVAKEILDVCHKKTSDEDVTEYFFGFLDGIDKRHSTFAPSTMLMHHQDDLITHDVTRRFILHKWNSFGRWFHFVWFIVNAVYTAFLTTLIVTAKTRDNNFNNNVNSTSKQNETCHFSTDPHYKAFPWVILAYIIIYFISQIIYICYVRLRYLTPVNIFTFITTILTFVFILPMVACQVNELMPILKGREDVIWQLGALAILFSWITLLFHYKHLFYGIYVEMLTEVLKTWLKVIAVFFILVIGFALSFHCVLDESNSFRHAGISIIKTIVWMIGEFDYDDLFVDQELKYRAVALFILVVFFIMMNITFINLLVGLAVGDIDIVQKKAFLILLKEKISALEVLFNTLPSCFQTIMYRKKLKDKRSHSILRRIMDGFGNVMMRSVERDFKKNKGGRSVRPAPGGSWRRQGARNVQS